MEDKVGAKIEYYDNYNEISLWYNGYCVYKTVMFVDNYTTKEVEDDGLDRRGNERGRRTYDSR